MQYGTYSAEADREYGHFVYTTPAGNEVIVTTVGPDPDAPGYNWPDKVSRGAVVTFVRSHKHDCHSGIYIWGDHLSRPEP